MGNSVMWMVTRGIYVLLPGIFGSIRGETGIHIIYYYFARREV
jgi:hypothetical protein